MTNALDRTDPAATTLLPRAHAGPFVFGLLGFSAGLPFYMFNAVLLLRLARHGVDVVTVGFFAWVALLPTFKFVWAPLVERFAVPGFAARWGRERAWIMLAQLGTFTSMAAMAATADDASLPLTALFATLLAFWTTTLEIAADGWRIEQAPAQAQQGPIVAANLWGYRSAMVAAGSGAALVAEWFGWGAAYLGVALVAFAAFPLMVWLPGEGTMARGRALATGLSAGAVILAVVACGFAAVGWVLLSAARGAGIDAGSNVTPWVLGVCLLPFVALAAALPWLQRMPADAPLLTSPAFGAYADLFWRYGPRVLVLLAFVSLYRMGDVMTLTLSHPQWNALGYTLPQIAVADGVVALATSMIGVGIGGWLAARRRIGWAMALAAAIVAGGNWVYVWLEHAAVAPASLYLAVAADQFGNGMAGTVFVVYLSLLVNVRHAAAQYALLSGFAFLLPRLLAGAGGAMVARIGYDGFFALSGALSLSAVLFLPFLARLRPRADAA